MKFFDLHCDTPYACFEKNQEFLNNTLAVSGRKGKVFEIWKQCYAVWIKDEQENAFSLYRSIIDDFKRKIRYCPDNHTPIFTLEGGSVLEDKLERLETLKNDGIRAITLTWNGENLLAGGVDSQKTLTDLGVAAIKEMNRLKIACDLSHINKTGFFEALEYAKYPLITHTCMNSIVAHKRNITEIQARQVAERGGIIGICFYPEFVGYDVFEGVYRNIYYLCELGLENSISIGSDFDGCQMSFCLDSIEKVPNLFDYLYNRGINDKTLNKIFYDNAEKFFSCL